jgi:large subunit ribosomal protein L29
MKVNEVVKELRALSNEELEAKIKESKKELFDLRLKQSTGSLEQPSKIRELRKNVARMKTILRERENGGEE